MANGTSTFVKVDIRSLYFDDNRMQRLFAFLFQSQPIVTSYAYEYCRFGLQPLAYAFEAKY